MEISQPPRRERSHVCPVMVSLCSARVQGGERGQRSARGVCFVAKAVRRPASQMYRCADSNASINLRPSVVVVVAQQSEGGGGQQVNTCVSRPVLHILGTVYTRCVRRRMYFYVIKRFKRAPPSLFWRLQIRNHGNPRQSHEKHTFGRIIVSLMRSQAERNLTLHTEALSTLQSRPRRGCLLPHCILGCVGVLSLKIACYCGISDTNRDFRPG